MTIRGTISAWDGATYLATVRLDGGSLNSASIRTSRGIPSADMVVGRKVLIDTGDEASTDDYVVVAVYVA